MKGLRNILGGKDALIMSLVKHKSGRTVSTYLPANLPDCPANQSVFKLN